MTRETQCDSEQLREDLDFLNNQIVEYQKYINDFFKTLNLLNDDKIWVGNSSKKYSDVANIDKEDYVEYGNNLKELFKVMRDFSSDLDDSIKKNEDICASSTSSSSYSNYGSSNYYYYF